MSIALFRSRALLSMIALTASACQFNSSGVQFNDGAVVCSGSQCTDATAADAATPAADAMIPDNWYAPGWSFRRQIVIDKDKIDAELMAFPVLVSLTDPEIIQAMRADGGDILFTTTTGLNKLPHQIELFDRAANKLIAWVLVPELSATEDTRVFLYYGNADGSADNNPTAVWDIDYHGVWHLDEATVDEANDGAHSDSTSRLNPGRQNGNAQVGGVIGFAQQFDGVDDEIDVANPTSFILGDANCTVSAWIRTTDTLRAGIVIKSPNGFHEPNDRLFGINYTANRLGIDHGWIGYLGGTSTINDGEWHHVAWVQRRDSSGPNDRWELYVDGEEDSNRLANPAVDNPAHTLRIGSSVPGSFFPYNFLGDLDEVRISNSARSPAWIAASYRNQVSPATFYTVGAEQALSGK